MKTYLILIGMLVFFQVQVALGQTEGHYLPGLSGGYAAFFPDSGSYFQSNIHWYRTKKQLDGNGVSYLAASRGDQVYWYFNYYHFFNKVRLLGATYGFGFWIPLVSADVTQGTQRFNTGGIKFGDIYITPVVLHWKLYRFHMVGSYGVYFPTGRYDGEVTFEQNSGLGFYTHMISFDASYSLDPFDMLTINVSPRFEFHQKAAKSGLVSGDNINLEWAISRSFYGLIDVGLVGYCVWQITEAENFSSIEINTEPKKTVYALGGELALFIPRSRIRGYWRINGEFAGRNSRKGMTNVFGIIINQTRKYKRN